NDLLVIQTQTHDRLHLLFYEVFYFSIIIAFVYAANDPDSWLLHAFKRIISGIYVSGFAVIDVFHAAIICNLLQTMLHRLKSHQRMANAFIADIQNLSGDRRGKAVRYI